MKHRYNVNCNISFLLGLIYATIILIKVPSVNFWPKTGLQGEKESLLGTVSLLPSPGIGRKYTNNTNVIFKRRDPVTQFSGPVTLTATKNSFLLPNKRTVHVKSVPILAKYQCVKYGNLLVAVTIHVNPA